MEIALQLNELIDSPLDCLPKYFLSKCFSNRFERRLGIEVSLILNFKYHDMYSICTISLFLNLDWGTLIFKLLHCIVYIHIPYARRELFNM